MLVVGLHAPRRRARLRLRWLLLLGRCLLLVVRLDAAGERCQGLLRLWGSDGWMWGHLQCTHLLQLLCAIGMCMC